MTDEPEKPSKAPVLSLVERRKEEPTWKNADEVIEDFRVFAQDLKLQNVAIHFTVIESDGRLRPHTWHHNMSSAEVIAFAELAKQRAIEDWRS